MTYFTKFHSRAYLDVTRFSAFEMSMILKQLVSNGIFSYAYSAAATFLGFPAVFLGEKIVSLCSDGSFL